MRRLLSIALLLLIGFPLISPLLAQGNTSDSRLPACCRRNGKHHCMMGQLERASAASGKIEVGAPPEKCPYCPSSVATAAQSPLALAATVRVFGTLDTLPAVVAQTESKWRIARERSRQKRGPPNPSLL